MKTSAWWTEWTTKPSIHQSINPWIHQIHVCQSIKSHQNRRQINLWIHHLHQFMNPSNNQSIIPSFHQFFTPSVHQSIDPLLYYESIIHWWTLKWRIGWWIEGLNDWRIDGFMDWKIDELMYWWIDGLGLMKWWDCGLMDWWIEASSTIAFLTSLRGKFHLGVWYERQPRVSECVGQESVFPPPTRGMCS